MQNLLKFRALVPIKKDQVQFNFSLKKPYASQIDLAELKSQPNPLIDIIQEEIYVPLLKKEFSQFNSKKVRQLFLTTGIEVYYIRNMVKQTNNYPETISYYMKRDVFNKKGDFITSVEISQIFGELLGVWVIYFLNSIQAINLEEPPTNQNKQNFSLMEFGPGRGTLMCDVVRVLKQFNALNGIEINFIEFSPFMRKLQQENLMKTLQKMGIYLVYQKDEQKRSDMEVLKNQDPNVYVKLRWFQQYEDFLLEDFDDILKQKQNQTQKAGSKQAQKEKQQPQEAEPEEVKESKQSLGIRFYEFIQFYFLITRQAPIVILAHEFFDALPVHKFVYDQNLGWLQKLVNISHDPLKQKHFQYITSLQPNQNVEKILKPNQVFENTQELKHGDEIQVSPQSLIMIDKISELISKTNGAALIIDYGNNHGFSDSLRGISNHKFVNEQELLDYPGDIDLSCYVNFKGLSNTASKVNGITTFGPMPQGLFLESMGINQRLLNLSQNLPAVTVKQFESECQRLVSPDEMGEIYKVLYVGQKVNGQVFPFVDENQPLTF